MAMSSKVWEKAERSAGPAAEGLKFNDDLGESLDRLEELAEQYLALEAKLYRFAKKMHLAAKKVRRVADQNIETIRSAADAKPAGKEWAALNDLMKQVDESVKQLKDTSLGEVALVARRELAIVRKLVKVLK